MQYHAKLSTDFVTRGRAELASQKRRNVATVAAIAIHEKK
jgi:hypothetical protein